MSIFQRIIGESTSQADSAEHPPVATRAILGRKVAMRILVADDHGLVRETIAAFLMNEGFPDVVGVASLDEAVAQAKKTGAFDLVLLD